jgi:hypothetical protein
MARCYPREHPVITAIMVFVTSVLAGVFVFFANQMIRSVAIRMAGRGTVAIHMLGIGT